MNHTLNTRNNSVSARRCNNSENSDYGHKWIDTLPLPRHTTCICYLLFPGGYSSFCLCFLLVCKGA